MRVLCSIVLAVFSLTLLAQEKAIPPTSRLAPPSDSVAAKPTNTKAQPDKPEIELPEVLILGTNRSRQINAEKEHRTPAAPVLFHSDAEAGVITSWFEQERNKPAFIPGTHHVNEHGWASVSAGNYLTLTGNAGYWRRVEDFSLNVRARSLYTGGQYKNSTATHAEMSGIFHLDSTPRWNTKIQTRLANRKFGLYSLLNGDATRSINQADIFGSTEYKIPAAGRVTLVADLTALTLETDTSESSLEKSRGNNFTLQGTYQDNFGPIPVTISGNIFREKLKPRENGNSRIQDAGSIGFSVKLPVNMVWHADIGLDYQTYASDSMKTTHQFAPRASLIYAPNNNVGLAMQVFSGYGYTAYSSRFDDNHFLTHTPEYSPNDARFGAQFTLEMQLLATLSMQTRFRYTNMQQVQYWSSNGNGLFRLQTLQDVESTDIRFIVEYTPVDKVHIQLVSSAYRANYQDSALKHSEAIPYKPQVTFESEINVDLRDNLSVRAGTDYTGRRYLNPDNSGWLTGVWNVSTGLDYKVTKRYQLQGTINNLLNREYDRWEGIPGTGIQVLFGGRATF